MDALATPPTDSPAEERTLLQGVSWEDYEQILEDNAEASGRRLTYDSGNLEIMTASIAHEQPNRTLSDLVVTILVEWDIDFLPAGSNTFRRRDLAKGFEPDSSFYIENVEAVRGKKKLDLRFDPPPDLVIEVEVTHSLVPKLPILAAVGVREIWHWENEAVRILCLEGAGYREARRSSVLAPLRPGELSSFLEQRVTMTGPAWIRAVRAWAQAHAR